MKRIFFSVDLRTHIRFRLAALLLAALSSSSVMAYETVLIQHLELGQKSEAYGWLQKNLSRYREDPRFNDLLAQLALALNDYDGAITALERLVKLQPSHLGARLDLVIAYRQQGQIENATEELKELLIKVSRLERMPVNVADAIAKLEKELILTPRRRNFYAELEVAAGRDTNVNQGSSINEFILDLQNPTPIVLGEESVEQADNYASTLLQFGAVSSKAWCDRSFLCGDIYMYAGQRLHNEERQYDRYDLGLMGSLNLFQVKHPWYASAFAFRSDTDAFGTDDVYGLELRKHWILPDFTFKAAVSSSKNTNSLSDLPDRQQTALSFQMSRSQYSVQLLGIYLDQPKRIPGDTWQSQVRWTAWHPMENWLLKGSLKYVYLRDTEPFATVFFGDAIRREEEYSASLKLSKKIAPGLSLAVEAGYSYVSSNIPIFERDRLNIASILNYRW